MRGVRAIGRAWATVGAAATSLFLVALAAGCAGASVPSASGQPDAGGEVLFGDDASLPLPREDAGSPDAAEAGGAVDDGGPRRLRVGTWNLEGLGQDNKRLDLAARVIEANFDVVALVEVMNPLGLQQLLGFLPGWTATLSDRAVGEGAAAEFYAVLVRRGTATVRSSRIVDDAADEWVREPMLTCLVARGLDFCLVQTHVVFGSTVGPRDLEIQALARLVGRLRADTPSERDVLVVGDFNRPGNAPSFSSFTAIGYRFSDDGLTKTTIGPSGYVNAYDHVLLDPVATREWLGDSLRVDIVADVCGGSFDFCARSVSDHAPMAITLESTAVDDD
jgi:endonuclease/exonuclease/phosphatase family metal-dependent hydrolase